MIDAWLYNEIVKYCLLLPCAVFVGMVFGMYTKLIVFKYKQRRWLENANPKQNK